MTKLTKKQRSTQIETHGCQLTAVGIRWPRKNLTVSEWSEMGQFLERADSGVQWWIGDWLRYGEDRPRWGSRYAEEIEKWQLSGQRIIVLKLVAKSIQLLRRRSNLTFKHHEEVASLSEKQQDHWLGKAEKNKWSAGKLRSELRLDRQRRLLASSPLPDGKFRVILADPPWEYGDTREGVAGHTGSGTVVHYPTLDIDAICALPVENLAAKNAVLFLWVTTPLLDECFPVIDAWGFEYKTSFVWDKVKPYVGSYLSVQQEFLLLCTRGSCLPDVSDRPSSVISIPKSSKHSQKPSQFYGLIELLYSPGPYLELFARNDRKGWRSWGNEITKQRKNTGSVCETEKNSKTT